MFLENGDLKICSKFTGEHPRRSVISIKLLWICRANQLTGFYMMGTLVVKIPRPQRLQCTKAKFLRFFCYHQFL